MKTRTEKLAVLLMILPAFAIMLLTGSVIAAFAAPQAEVPHFLTRAVWGIYPLAWIFSIANYFLFRNKPRSLVVRSNLIVSQLWIILMAVVIVFLIFAFA